MTEDTIQNLIRKYHVPIHIQAHMKKVAAVAVFIGNEIKNSGELIDVENLRKAALLHDMVKVCDFKKMDIGHCKEKYTKADLACWKKLQKTYADTDHAHAACKILMDIHEPVLATIIKKHNFKSLIDPKEKPQTWEEKVLYYADKRVKHDQIVSLQERLRDGRKRYYPKGNIPEKDSSIEKALLKLEKEICDKIKLKPEDISGKTIKSQVSI